MVSQEVPLCGGGNMFPFKPHTFLVQSVPFDDWTPDAEAQKFLWINLRKITLGIVTDLCQGKLCGKYSVGSDAWCRANVCGGICSWQTCMSCFDPDGPGQCSGDRWGKRKERFLVLTTGSPSFWHIYSLAQSVTSFFSLLPPIQHVLPRTLPEIYSFSSLPFTSPFPNFVTFLWARVKLFTFVVEWTMIFSARGCGGKEAL